MERIHKKITIESLSICENNTTFQNLKFILGPRRSSNDSRNHDSARFHGLQKLFKTSIWLSKPPVSTLGK